jgi:hypothetical protein
MSEDNTRTVEIPPLPPDEEVFRWHGTIDASDEARDALQETADAEGISYREALDDLQRRRYRHSQVDWPLMIGEAPKESLSYHRSGMSFITTMELPTGKRVALETHTGVATEIRVMPVW